MKSFINESFLLNTEAARELYHTFAAHQPIIDYHCHLSPADIANNRRFESLFDIWLAGDHYKWRAMRLNGESESVCTGDAPPYEKFLAFARTVPKTLRNPIHHWTHLELRRYFDIGTLLDETTAPRIWAEANEKLTHSSLSVWGVLERFRVKMVGTTDDPTDDLRDHIRIAASACPTKVLPSFRPDKAFAIGQTENWNRWTDRLEAVSGHNCGSFEGFLQALGSRVDYFHNAGCLASDHGLERCPRLIATHGEAASLFARARIHRETVSEAEAEAFMGYVLTWLGGLYAERSWVMQLHVGAIRNVNRGLFQKLGPDIGCDSIHDVAQIDGMARVLGELSLRGKLPRTVIYNLDPAKNYAFATMCGNFFEQGIAAKVQFGSGWWFNDQLEGMTNQINALSQLGLLSHFIGMLTDSRSFMSFPRHEYFRRLLCRIIGQDIEGGLIPNDLEAAGKLVADVSYHNARRYFRL